MNTIQAMRCASAIVIAIALGAGTLTTAKAETIEVMRHATPALPGYGELMLEIWTDGAAVQVIGLIGQGRIVLAREGTLAQAPTLDGTGAIEGRLPADQLQWVMGTELAYQWCADASCARAIATRAESIGAPRRWVRPKERTNTPIHGEALPRPGSRRRPRARTDRGNRCAG